MSTEKDSFDFFFGQSMAYEEAFNEKSLESTLLLQSERLLIRDFNRGLPDIIITNPMPEKKHPLNKKQVKSKSKARAAKQARKHSR